MTKRRAKGDGGITQRSDGRWQGSFLVTDESTGTKRRRYVYGKTKAEAMHKLKTAIRDRDAGALVVSTVTVETWMTRWLAAQERRLKPQTLRSHTSKVQRYIVPNLGGHKLTSLRGRHITAMYDKMRDDGLAESTIRQTHNILGGALRAAIRADLLARSPMEKAETPGTEKGRREQFTVVQAQQVLAAAGDDARWWLALFYGMRQGECLGLDWRSVDFDRHILTIEQTLQTDTSGRLILGSPKSTSSTRPLPMVPLIEARLRLLWEREGRPTSGLVFHNGGKPIQPKRDWQAWRDLIDRATTPPLTPLPYIALHAARNTASSLMEAAGIPDRLVMQILGQSQVSTTHRYQSADLERMRQAFAALGSSLELE